MFLQASYRLSVQNLCVFSESMLISPDDYIDPRPLITTSRLQCHWNTGGDQILHPNSALIPLRSTSPIIPSPAFCCVENGLRLLLRLLKAEMDLFLFWVKLEWDTFHFYIFFPVGMQGVLFFFFFCLSDSAFVIGESCCYVTLCCLISLFFMFILWLSQQLSRG